MHFFSAGCTCVLIRLPFPDPFTLWERQFLIPLGVHLEILYGYCIHIPFLCPPGWQRGHACVCSYFKEDVLTVIRRERLPTPGGPPPWHLMKAQEGKWFLLFFFFFSNKMIWLNCQQTARSHPVSPSSQDNRERDFYFNLHFLYIQAPVDFYKPDHRL